MDKTTEATKDHRFGEEPYNMAAGLVCFVRVSRWWDGWIAKATDLRGVHRYISLFELSKVQYSSGV